MRKAVKIGSQAFVFLDEQTLFLDRDQTTIPYPFPLDVTNKVLDFSLDESTRSLKAFTTDGDAIILVIDSNADATICSFGQPFIAASIHDNEILAISNDYRAFLYNFQGEQVKDFPEIHKHVCFCFLSGTLKAVADSSRLYVRKAKSRAWEKHKFREVQIKSILDVGRHMEFALIAGYSTRIVRDGFQTFFRSWARQTVALLRCPIARPVYAHLDPLGRLRIGTADGDCEFEEPDVAAACWEFGVLWARGGDRKWRRLLLALRDELYDLRPTRLEHMEVPLAIQGPGRVVKVLNALRHAPALAREVLEVLPPIAQDITDGAIVGDVKQALDEYITRTGAVQQLLGQIDLVLSASPD
jgi:hypothetical protein